MAGQGANDLRVARNPGVSSVCDALSPDHLELLARAVILVAGMAIPEAARAAVLARVTAEWVAATEQPPKDSGGVGEGKGATEDAPGVVYGPHSSGCVRQTFA